VLCVTSGESPVSSWCHGEDPWQESVAAETKRNNPKTSIGNSPCKMAENYLCAGIIINKVWNYYENTCNCAQQFFTLEGEGIKTGKKEKIMKLIVAAMVACLMITVTKTTTTMMIMMMMMMTMKMTVMLTMVMVMVFVMI
jgi:hypothetical protein